MSELTTQKTVSGLVNFNRYLTNDTTKNYLAEVLGAKKDSFVTNCVSLVSNNVNLQNCAPNTIMYSAIKATTLGLPLDNNLGFAYVLPYRNNKKGTDEAQFQMGYKGFIQLAMRSGQFKTINATDVKKGEILDIDRLTGDINFAWLPEGERSGAEIVGFIAYFELLNGFKKSFYMSKTELEAHGKKYSKSYNSPYSNWSKIFDAMAIKTVIKLLLSKYAPLSVEMAEAVKYDQTVIHTPDAGQYVDNTEIVDAVDVSAVHEKEETERVLKFLDDCKTIKAVNKLQASLSDDLKTKFNDEFNEKVLSLSTKTAK